MSEPIEMLPPIVVSTSDGDGGRLWPALREALRGSTREYTTGPIGRAVFVLAVPMVLEMAMESIFAVTDVFFVSRLGADAIATVGLTESLLASIYAVAVGLAIGATATVARRIGEHDRDGAARSAVQATLLGIIVSAVIGFAGVRYGGDFLRIMGASPGELAHASYTRIMLGGNATILLLFLVNAIFRGAGDAAIAMRVLWLANFINIVLGPCLIFGLGPFPRLGVAGAAIATTIGRGTGVAYAFSRLLRRGGRIEIRRRHLRVEPARVGRIARLSGSGALQAFVATASFLGVVRILATYGSDALAGYTIAMRVIMFALLPSWGLGNAAATMVGQSLGAGKPERAERAVWLAALYNLCFLGAMGIALVFCAPSVIALFTRDAGIATYGVDALRIVAAGFVFYAVGGVVTQAFNGAGDTLTPTWLNLAVFWCGEIPLAYVLAAPLRFGPRGVFVAIFAAFSILALASAALFRRGTWKSRMV